MSVTYLYLNNQRSPLNDVRVRQAISYAVDYDALIQGVMLGSAVQMRGPVPQGMWSHDPEAYQYTLDLEKARALLAEAGYSGGLTLGYLYSPVYPEWEQIGLALQAQLAADRHSPASWSHSPYATMRAMLGEGDFDIAVGNWSPDFADPYMFMNYWFDSANGGLPGNRSFYSNPTVDASHSPRGRQHRHRGADAAVPGGAAHRHRRSRLRVLVPEGVPGRDARQRARVRLQPDAAGHFQHRHDAEVIGRNARAARAHGHHRCTVFE